MHFHLLNLLYFFLFFCLFQIGFLLKSSLSFLSFSLSFFLSYFLLFTYAISNNFNNRGLQFTSITSLMLSSQIHKKEENPIPYTTDSTYTRQSLFLYIEIHVWAFEKKSSTPYFCAPQSLNLLFIVMKIFICIDRRQLVLSLGHICNTFSTCYF